jgi:hypothetical protein
MKLLKVILGWAGVLILAGCASSSSSGVDLTVSRGDATGPYAGTYTGTISLTSTADVVGKGVATDSRVETVSLRVTADGLVFMTVEGVVISGVVDNSGNWGVQASVDDLRGLVSQNNLSLLQDAGCSLGTKAARIQGQINPPSMRGDVSGTLKCKRAEVTVATLNTTGSLAASTARPTPAHNTPVANDTAPTTPGGPQEFNLNKAVYLHTNVSGWPETHKLTVEIGGGVICLNGGFTTDWPPAEIDHTSGQYTIQVNANPWVFVNRGGTWYGGTWEWFAVGNTCKPARNVEGGHIKQPPLADWTPVSGETVYMMVASISRGSNLNNYQARTDAVKVVWP